MTAFPLFQSPNSTVATTSSTNSRRFDDCYRIEERLHSGSYGTVYRVTCKHNLKTYAVKIMDRQLAQQKNHEDDIYTEARILQDLTSHDSTNQESPVVGFVEFLVDDDRFYLVQEWAPGGDLFDLVASEGRVYCEQQARTVTIRVLQAVRHLHSRGVIHRDIKAENVLLQDPNDCTSVVLADFGFATYLPGEGYVQRRCGTPDYIAPEVWKQQPYGKSCDMWAVGCLLYMILSGFPPFHSTTNNLEEIEQAACQGRLRFDGPAWQSVSFEAKEFLCRLLTVDPYLRFTAEDAWESKWIQSGLTDALFDDLDSWTPQKCGTSTNENAAASSFVWFIERVMKLG